MNNTRYHKFNINSKMNMPNWKQNLLNNIQNKSNESKYNKIKPNKTNTNNRKKLNLSEDDIFDDDEK